MTTLTIPQHLFTGEARGKLVEGLQNATAGACPDRLYERMADEDLRWDQLSDRAIARALPEIVALLDAAFEAEWERTPIEMPERRRQPEAGEALVSTQ